MILAITDIKTSFKKFNPGCSNLKLISYCIAGYAVFCYPHTMLGGVKINAPAALEVMFCVSFSLYACARILANESLITPSQVSRPLAALCILVIIAGASARNIPLALESIFLFFAYIGCFYIFLDLFNTLTYRYVIAWIIVLVALYLSIKGLPIFHEVNQRTDDFWRLRSTFGNSNQMGGLLAMTIPFLMGMIYTRKFPPLLSAALFAGLGIMAVALFFTLARGAWVSTMIATGVVCLVYMMQNRQNITKILAGTLAATLALGLIFLSSTDLVQRFTTITQQDPEVTLYGRMLAWEGTIDMIQAHPLLGVGPGNFTTAFRGFQPPGLGNGIYVKAHSDYLEFISETGLLLLPILLWLGYRLFSHGIAKIRHSTDARTRGITLGAMGGIIAILVYSFTDFNLQIPANALLFTVLAALIATPNQPAVRLA